MPNTDSHLCANCSQPLIYIKVGHYHILACDNAKEQCYLFRERQLIIPLDDDEPKEKPKGLPSARVQRADYEVTKAMMRENYQYATSLGIPSGEAARTYRYKSKEEIEKAAAAMTH